MCWRCPLAWPTVRTVNPERTSDEHGVRPTRSRRAPGPRGGEDSTFEALTGPTAQAVRPAVPVQPPPGATPLPASSPYHAGMGAGDVPPATEPTVPSNIYRARRPATAALLIVPALVVGLLLVRALAISAFGSPFQVGGVIASSAGLAALPLLVTGLYGLMTGAAHGAEQWGFRVWARPPLAYLVVGILLVVAAAIAAP